MKFQQLQINQDKKSLKERIQSPQFLRTIKAIGIGMAAGLLYYYLTKGRNVNEILFADLAKSAVFGGLLGFWVTNSPCARGNCQR